MEVAAMTTCKEKFQMRKGCATGYLSANAAEYERSWTKTGAAIIEAKVVVVTWKESQPYQEATISNL